MHASNVCIYNILHFLVAVAQLGYYILYTLDGTLIFIKSFLNRYCLQNQKYICGTFIFTGQVMLEGQSLFMGANITRAVLVMPLQPVIKRIDFGQDVIMEVPYYMGILKLQKYIRGHIIILVRLWSILLSKYLVVQIQVSGMLFDSVGQQFNGYYAILVLREQEGDFWVLSEVKGYFKLGFRICTCFGVGIVTWYLYQLGN
eukprot:TRINITY_DN22998_c0_g1_i4.p2 TRINITY_DN22998_c0_g1~~TRINITY_DN22998_c0_g1_i4.p2  ORF type:complete len:201 (-),score=-5.81 TRINITY_DN22998_c0_g1_i4:23-625(-)